MSQDPGQRDQHPAPHRGRVSIVASLASLIAGPAAWVAQLVIGYGLSSLACFPHDVPFQTSPPPGWANEAAILALVNGACLVIALLGLLTAFVHWRRTRGEKAGGAHHALEVGEGRTRFMAVCGMLSGFGFALAILFDTPAWLAVPACWAIAT